MLHYLTDDRKHLVYNIVLTLVNAFTMTFYAYVLQWVMYIATGKIKMSFVTAIWLLLGYVVLSNAIDSLWQYDSLAWPTKISQRIRNDVFATIDDFDPSTFNHTTTGSYVAKLTKQVDLVQQSYFQIILFLAYNAAQLVIATIGTLLINPLITGLIVLLSIPSVILPFLTKKYLENAKEGVVDQLDHYTSHITDFLQGFTTVQYALSQPIFFRRHQAANQELTDASTRDVKVQKIIGGISNAFSDVLYFGTWLLGAWFVQQGQMDLGQLVAFSQLSAMLNWPMASMIRYLTELYGGRKAASELQSVLAQKVDRPTTTMAQLTTTDPFIVGQHLAFQIDDQPILKDVSFRLGAKEKVLLVGASGSGKSTLVRTLLNEVQGYSGHMTINGVDLKQIDRLAVYRTIGIMEQHGYIFQGNVRENVSLFDHQYSDKQIITALDRAGLANWLTTHDLDTPLSDRGPELSGGEKQRLALARLYLRGYRYFIFDELTTGLDPNIATTLEHDLFQLPQGFLLITHRYNDEIFRAADRILVMSHGKLVTQGNFRSPAVQRELRRLQLVTAPKIGPAAPIELAPAE
ncbi:MAG: ABC transporter ATP-binding protein [Schleiferilactobacillus perolens]|jgi:ABC-type multidrug transport system fused ATPase/permease subunit|uniref:ABC transporter ATP-binding protein n=1 Tax=Schleiferilactobacillus perolens TaxID=100468 RepID=UPI0039ED5C3E